MNKEEELVAVLSVFGLAVAESAVHHESPDFLVIIPGGSTVGIEVTSVYESQTAAKLEKLDGYSMGLLDGTISVHRSDKERMEVGDVRLEKADGEFVDTVRAIIRPYPSLGERFSLLCARIDAKAKKVTAYSASCNELDLIVLDSDCMFAHPPAEDFHRFLMTQIDKRLVLGAPFREIYLVTQYGALERVYWPLRANIFVSDCLAFAHLIEPQWATNRPRDELFTLFVSAMYFAGHTGMAVKAEDDSESFLCGTWEMHFGADATAIRQWGVHARPFGGRPAAELICQESASMMVEVRDLLTKRSELYSNACICLPCATGI